MVSQNEYHNFFHQLVVGLILRFLHFFSNKSVSTVKPCHYIMEDQNFKVLISYVPLSVPIEPNRTELLVRFEFGSSNLSSGSGSVRFNHVMLYFISKKKVLL